MIQGIRRRRLGKVRTSPEGYAYLNAGCGNHYSVEWTNLDLFSAEHVTYHRLTEPLPYLDGVFDAAYASHVLEHLTLPQATAFLAEINRVLKPGGLVRLAVPDLEGICREYLRLTEALARERSERHLLRHRWIKLELLDQMVRERPGGAMRDATRRGEVDWSYVSERCGDEFAAGSAHPPAGSPGRRLTNRPPRELARVLASRIRRLMGRRPDPRRTGEAHRWMYEAVSLEIMLEERGFRDIEVTNFARSVIPHWSKYDLDRSAVDPTRPRKPDSLFIEARKAGVR